MVIDVRVNVELDPVIPEGALVAHFAERRLGGEGDTGALKGVFPTRRGGMHFGALPLYEWPLLEGVTAIFSNNGHDQDERTRLEMTVLRQFLDEEGVPELGFGTDAGGYTWVMIIETEDGDHWAEKAREARWAVCDPQSPRRGHGA